VLEEPETTALHAWFEQPPTTGQPNCSTLKSRAGEQLRVPGVTFLAVLAALSLRTPSAHSFSSPRAAPTSLRSRDALHRARALELGGDLEGFVTYDRRLTEGARSLSMNVIAPR
jgi:hypothetical protein